MERLNNLTEYKNLVNRESVGVKVVNANTVKVNRLDEEFITPNIVVTIPNFEGYNTPLIEGDKGGHYFISLEGIKVWVSMLQKGAKELETGNFISPSGSAVDALQECASWEEFLSTYAGRQLHFIGYQEVNNGYPKPRKVWEVDLVDNTPTSTSAPTRTTRRRNS